MTAFDPAKCSSSLHPRSSSRASNTSSSNTSTSDIAHLTTIVNAIIQPKPMPSTPTKKATPVSEEIPYKNTPLKLSRFLCFAQASLSIPDALEYEHSLPNHGYGPNILHLLKCEDLTNVGFSAGDAIRLQQHGQEWCCTIGEKHKHDADPPNEQVDSICLEKHWKDGSGAATFWGTKLVDGDTPPDYDWWFYCQVTKAMQPVLRGMVPVLEEGDMW